MLEVVDELAHVGTVVGGVELALDLVPDVVVRAEGRRRVLVGDRRPRLDVVLAALAGLGLDVLAHGRGSADRGEVEPLELAQLPPVLDGLVGRGYRR